MIGEKLYELRRKNNLSQEEVAEKLNVSRQTVSKWETNQSQPDFDKIIPICNLFRISTEELLTGKKQDKIIGENSKNKTKALVISISTFLYFLAVIFIILADSFNLDSNLVVSIFLFIIAVSTCLLIFYFVSINKDKKEEKVVEEYEKYDGILAIFFTIIYFLISFLTLKWQITWIIWLVYALLIEIIHLVLKMKGDK